MSRGGTCRFARHILFIALVIVLVAAPASAGAVSNVTGQPRGTAPGVVTIGIYVIDFNRVDVGAGSVGVDFFI